MMKCHRFFPTSADAQLFRCRAITVAPVLMLVGCSGTAGSKTPSTVDDRIFLECRGTQTPLKTLVAAPVVLIVRIDSKAKAVAFQNDQDGSWTEVKPVSTFDEHEIIFSHNGDSGVINRQAGTYNGTQPSPRGQGTLMMQTKCTKVDEAATRPKF